MHADSADISSTDILKRGFGSIVWNDGFRGFCATAIWDLLKDMNKGGNLKVQLSMIAAFLVCASAFAADAPAKRGFEQVPRQALVELKATIGKPFTAGLVFIDGKFIPPPYKVERYGTAFRIN